MAQITEPLHIVEFRARAGLEFWAFDRAHPEFDCSEHCPDCDPMACPVFLKCEEIFNKGGRS